MMIEKKIRLKPCPFCGNDSPQFSSNADAFGNIVPIVFCNWCKCEYTVEDAADHEEDYLAEKWNCREKRPRGGNNAKTGAADGGGEELPAAGKQAKKSLEKGMKLFAIHQINKRDKGEALVLKTGRKWAAVLINGREYRFNKNTWEEDRAYNYRLFESEEAYEKALMVNMKYTILISELDKINRSKDFERMEEICQEMQRMF